MILTLRNDDPGRYAVTTATGSEYVIDLDCRTVTRRVAPAPPLVDYLEVPMALLRRDEEELELLMLERLEIGYPARLWLQVRADHVPTLRTTSPVTKIVLVHAE
jgi:hypothetical protein